MEIKHTDNEKKGSFFLAENGQISAEITYVWAGTNRIIIDHTEVDDKWRGKGVGKKLVTAAIHFARSKNLKVLPLCPYAKSVFDKDPSLSDLL